MKSIEVPEQYIIRTKKTKSDKPSSRFDPKAPIPVQIFDITVLDTPNVNGQSTQFIIYDYSIDESGGLVDVTLNGRYLKTVRLTVSGDVISLPNLKPGTNTLGFVGREEPPTGPIIMAARFDRTDILPEEPYFQPFVVNGGERKNLDLGFPQVQFSKAKYPESAQHVLDAWANPPRPMSKPISGKPENPLRTKPYPRLLTVDRDRPEDNPPYLEATKRGRRSTRNYKCKTGRNADEYPPKVFIENAGIAHIKCISESDNKGSGSSFGSFLKEDEYQARPGAKKVTIPNGAVVEFYLAK